MKKILFTCLSFLIAFSINAQLDRSQVPAPGPAPKINIGKAKTFELKNGLKVIVVENHKMPVVTYSLNLDIDPVMEGDKAGYVSMAGDLMKAGTTTKAKASIDEEIDFIGAHLGTSSTSIVGSSLKKFSDNLLDIMEDVLLNPSYPQEELDKYKKQALTALTANKQDAEAIASNVSSAIMYGKDHPYGELMSETTVGNISVEDLKSYHDIYFRPNVAYLVIVGDITLKEAKKQAKAHFGAWEAAEVPRHQYEALKPFDTPVVAVSNRDGAPQSYINLCYALDFKPGNPDAIKSMVMNHILGGGSFNARLFQNLREDKAFTYGAYSSLSSDELCGHFLAFSNVRTSVTDSAFTEVIYEMNRIRDELVDEADLSMVKNALTGSFSRSLEDPATVAKFALNIQKYNLPGDYYETFLEKLNAVSPQDVKEMAQKYIQPDHALILAVGDVSAIKPALAKFSESEEVTMYDFYGNEVKSLPLPAGLTAQKVIDDYVDAIGGEEALSAINSYSMEGNMTVQGMTLKMNTYSARPNKTCVETFMGDNLMSKQVFDGEKGKVISPMGEQELQGPMLEKMKVEGYMFPESQMEQLGYSAELLGCEDVDGEDCYKVKITDALGTEKTVFFSRNTGLKLKEVSQMPQGSMVIRYKDYTEVNGVKFPKTLNQTIGQQAVEVVFGTPKVNDDVDSSKFKL